MSLSRSPISTINMPTQLSRCLIPKPAANLTRTPNPNPKPSLTSPKRQAGRNLQLGVQSKPPSRTLWRQ